MESDRRQIYCTQISWRIRRIIRVSICVDICKRTVAGHAQSLIVNAHVYRSDELFFCLWSVELEHAMRRSMRLILMFHIAWLENVAGRKIVTWQNIWTAFFFRKLFLNCRIMKDSLIMKDQLCRLLKNGSMMLAKLIILRGKISLIYLSLWTLRPILRFSYIRCIATQCIKVDILS